MVQKRALRCIYSGESYKEILDRNNLPTLAEQRSKISKEYFDKMKKDNDRHNHLLPGLLKNCAISNVNFAPVLHAEGSDGA